MMRGTQKVKYAIFLDFGAQKLSDIISSPNSIRQQLERLSFQFAPSLSESMKRSGGMSSWTSYYTLCLTAA